MLATLRVKASKANVRANSFVTPFAICCLLLRQCYRAHMAFNLSFVSDSSIALRVIERLPTPLVPKPPGGRPCPPAPCLKHHVEAVASLLPVPLCGSCVSQGRPSIAPALLMPSEIWLESNCCCVGLLDRSLPLIGTDRHSI